MLTDSYVAFGAEPDVAETAANDVVEFEIELANVGALLEIKITIFYVSCIYGYYYNYT